MAKKKEIQEPINPYLPFTEEEFTIIKSEMKAMGYWLPRDVNAQRKLWQNCTRIRGSKENQPCTCKTSSGLWSKCVDDINNFIKGVEGV